MIAAYIRDDKHTVYSITYTIYYPINAILQTL